MPRIKEYAFLLYAVVVAAVYAIVHDHLTATISPEYFTYGKGLSEDSFQSALTWLAVRASLGTGLLAGAALLVANGPRRAGKPPQLGYRAMLQASLIPLAAAVLLAASFGIVNARERLGTGRAADLGVPTGRTWRFVIVWAIHAGSYAGALLGTAAAVVLVVVWRRRPVPPHGELTNVRTRGPKAARWVLRGAAVALIGYLSLCLGARLGYRVLLYPAPPDPPFVAPEGAKLLSLHAEDGVPVVAAQFPPPDDRARTVVIFHGNGETLGGRVDLAEDLNRLGLGAVLAEYRGYGLARGSGPPDEAGLYRDAIAVLDDLGRQGIGPDRIALLGISLGTGVAVEMAAQGRGATLILVSPYTSITAMAQGLFPFLPAAWLCPDKLDTLSKASRLHLPTLVIHGDSDEVVPFAMGREVAAATTGATLQVVHGGHHNDLFQIDGPELERAIAAAARR